MGEADSGYWASFDAIKTADTLRIAWILVYFYVCGADLLAFVALCALA